MNFPYVVSLTTLVVLMSLAARADSADGYRTTAAPTPAAQGATAAPAIGGTWQGDDWGTVVLKSLDDGVYVGTYTDTFGKEPGIIRVEWSAAAGRFDGIWREGSARHGRISIRVLATAKTIRGAWTAEASSEIRPGIPELADLEWQPIEQAADANQPEESSMTHESPPPEENSVAQLSVRIKLLESLVDQLRLRPTQVIPPPIATPQPGTHLGQPVPKNWSAHEFNGMVYYLVPLSTSAREKLTDE